MCLNALMTWGTFTCISLCIITNRELPQGLLILQAFLHLFVSTQKHTADSFDFATEEKEHSSMNCLPGSDEIR